MGGITNFVKLLIDYSETCEDTCGIWVIIVGNEVGKLNLVQILAKAVFHFALILLEKARIYFVSTQLWIYSRADWDRYIYIILKKNFF